MFTRPKAGLTLVETVLAVAVGFVLLAGTVASYRTIRQFTNMAQARAIVGTIQTNISMDKFRMGSAPPMNPSTTPSIFPATCSISGNLDSTGRPYWPQTSGSLPLDPVTGKNTIASYDSTLAAVAITAGASTDRYDNPVFGSPSPMGAGGWLYDTSTGTFRINLSNDTYPGDQPSRW